MIQHAFTGAYTNQVAQQNQVIKTTWGGVKDAATMIAGGLGFSGALGEGIAAKGAEHALAGRIGGIGGNIMLATMQEKEATQKANESKAKFLEQVAGKLSNNPINRSATNELMTVANKLRQKENEK
jgi:hypothetical protein